MHIHESQCKTWNKSMTVLMMMMMMIIIIIIIRPNCVDWLLLD